MISPQRRRDAEKTSFMKIHLMTDVHEAHSFLSFSLCASAPLRFKQILHS